MKSQRKTEVITFDLKDRGYDHVGQDRNVDLKAWIDAINSNATQELIKKGLVYGYYGHQVRMLWGMYPPETAMHNGKLIALTPALRTIEMSCTSDGIVSHRQEFLDNPFGDKALELYTTKVGGFSMATPRKLINGVNVPTGMAGMDYVFQPNYYKNMGDGALYDSIQNGEDELAESMLHSFLEMYDSIHAQAYQQALLERAEERALKAEEKLKNQRKHRQELINKKNDLMLDSLLCPCEPYDEYIQKPNEFLTAVIEDPSKEKEKEEKPKGRMIQTGLFGWEL